MPPVKMRGDGKKAKSPKKTLLRLLGYMKQYIPSLILVLICIAVSAVASTVGSENIGNLVDEYILPVEADEPILSLWKAVLKILDRCCNICWVSAWCLLPVWWRPFSSSI